MYSNIWFIELSNRQKQELIIVDEQKLVKWLSEHTNWQNVGMDIELPSYMRMHYDAVTGLCRHILLKMRQGDFD